MNRNVLADEAQLVLESVCERLGLDARGATLLRVRGNVVFKLRAPIVVRVAMSADAASRMPPVLAITRWLAAQGFPTIHPADEVGEQPVTHDGRTITFWRYVPPCATPATTAELGTIPHDLHTRAVPDIPLQTLTDPLRSIRTTVQRRPAVLTAEQQAWLGDRIAVLTGGWHDLAFSLPPSLLHGDPWIDNLWRTDQGDVVLGDWDHVAIGPREWDLIHTYHGHRRFGLNQQDVDDFARAYGHDLRDWSGYEDLMQIRDLYAVAVHIRNAPNDPFSHDELPRRLHSLMQGEHWTRWHLAPAP
jgi:hypothetical protein